MKLYEISETMIDTLNIFLESEQAEDDKELLDEAMEFLKEELKNKSSNIIKYINSLETDIEAIKIEEKRLTKIKKYKEYKINKLSNYIVSVMRTLDKSKIETDLGNYALRKSTKVDIIDETLIPEEYFKVKTEKTIDKAGLKESLKTKEVLGARLVIGYNLNIQ